MKQHSNYHNTSCRSHTVLQACNKLNKDNTLQRCTHSLRCDQSTNSSVLECSEKRYINAINYYLLLIIINCLFNVHIKSKPPHPFQGCLQADCGEWRVNVALIKYTFNCTFRSCYSAHHSSPMTIFLHQLHRLFAPKTKI